MTEPKEKKFQGRTLKDLETSLYATTNQPIPVDVRYPLLAVIEYVRKLEGDLETGTERFQTLAILIADMFREGE